MEKKISNITMAVIHALLSDLEEMDNKTNLVRRFTQQRESSIKEMTQQESKDLKQYLFDEKTKQAKPMRGKIIHLCCLMGMTNEWDGEADLDRIHHFIENIGSRNPKKKNLWKLTLKQLRNVTTQVDMIYKKSIK